MTTTHRIELKNDLGELGRLAEELEAYGDAHGMDTKVMNYVSLALEEVVTNIVSYGYHDLAEHRIIIDLSVVDDELTMRVEDDGMAFNPLAALPPDLSDDVDKRGVGGLGILLVRRLMDDARYVRDGGHNVLTLVKRTGARSVT